MSPGTHFTSRTFKLTGATKTKEEHYLHDAALEDTNNLLKRVSPSRTKGILLHYTGVGFGEFLNSSNSTTESMSVEETFKWTNVEIARLIQIIFRPILVIVGTVGNGLAIYIMRRTSLKYLSTCFYMFVLALADSSK